MTIPSLARHLTRQAAAFRGGELLDAGHWCPRCVADPTDYPRQALRNVFLAQVESAQPAP